MVAVSLRREIQRRALRETREKRVAADAGGDLGWHVYGLAASARTEMADGLHGIEQQRGVVRPGQDRDGDRASDIRRVEARMDGVLARHHATTPPTGIVPGSRPAGHASGMTTPGRIDGTRISASLCAKTCAALAGSASVSASPKTP